MEGRQQRTLHFRNNDNRKSGQHGSSLPVLKLEGSQQRVCPVLIRGSDRRSAVNIKFVCREKLKLAVAEMRRP